MIFNRLGRLHGFSADFTISLGRGMDGSRFAIRVVPGAGEAYRSSRERT